MISVRAKQLVPLLVTALVICISPRVHAQDSGLAALAGNLPTRNPGISDGGIRIGEGGRLHLGIGADVGYDTNVFYQGAQAAISSPLLRVVPYVDLNNQMVSGGPNLAYSLGATLQYRHYLAGEDRITSASVRDTISPTLTGAVDFGQQQRFGVGLFETFSRVEEAPYVSTGGAIVRRANLASVQLRLTPGGGRIQGLARYNNRYDYFETVAYRAASSLSQDVYLEVSWRLFPKTALFAGAQQTYVHYLDAQQTNAPINSTRHDSYPFRATTGLRGLITEKLVAALTVGYGKAFYSSGPSPSGLGLANAKLGLTYSPTQFSFISLDFQHEFQNSIIGNYFDLDAASLGIRQAFADRIVARAFVRLEHRSYSAPLDGVAGDRRVDNALSAGAEADYHLKSWAYAGVAYTALRNTSNAAYRDGLTGTVQTADYVKQQMFVRAGITY